MNATHPLRKGLALGMLASFFFAFTFVLNRSMNLGGGYWGWSASLRYLFTLPMLLILLLRGNRLRPVFAEIRRAPGRWVLWSSVGFGLFYAPLTLASVFGPSWFVAASWQITIVAGALLSPLWGNRIPRRQILWGLVILAGVFLLQLRTDAADWRGAAAALGLIVIAAVAYPLGNRNMMALCLNRLGTIQRVFGMTLCSMPFWLLLGGWSLHAAGLPARGQVQQAFWVALFSGVIATILFFRATELVRHNARQLALIEATQSGEVIFTLLLGLCFLHDSPPSLPGWGGLALILIGMICNSLSTGQPAAEEQNQKPH